MSSEVGEAAAIEREPVLIDLASNPSVCLQKWFSRLAKDINSPFVVWTWTTPPVIRKCTERRDDTM